MENDESIIFEVEQASLLKNNFKRKGEAKI